jgi:hypothetical protein
VEYVKGRIEGEAVCTMKNAEEPGSAKAKEVATFVRYLLQGLGQVASPPKVRHGALAPLSLHGLIFELQCL